jgi:hypothetical protein
MIKYKNTKVIEDSDWDNLVQETYGKPYHFQQQYGCQNRGVHNLTIPYEANDSEMPDSIPEVVNGEEMGVKFSAWLARDPKQPIKNQEFDYQLKLFWERNFYPDIQMVANDLHKKGLIEAGEYTINIDW